MYSGGKGMQQLIQDEAGCLSSEMETLWRAELKNHGEQGGPVRAM